MAGKVLLVMPRIEKYKDYHHLPFGILALASVLEQIGVAYDIFDERVDDVANLDKTIGDYSIVGVSMFTGFQTSRGIHWLRYTREQNPSAITIAGGPHVSALPEETAASPLVDFAVAGYAENSFGRLVEAIIQENGDIERVAAAKIAGVYSKVGDTISSMPTPRRYTDLEWGTIPYQRVNIPAYLNPASKLVMYVTQYGCPALCTFCATPETRKWSSKPLDLVFEDLDKLDELTNFQQLWFADATLFTVRPRTMELVAHLDDRYNGKQWIADARALELIKYSDDDFLAIKKCRADLTCLVVGLEFGSARLAEGIVKKGRNHLKNFAEVARRLHNAGIELTSGVVFGFPTETPSDLELTRKYITEIRKIHPNFKISTTFFRPLPGTDLYDLVKDTNFIGARCLEDWENIGQDNHYQYNQWMDVPWMAASEKAEYARGYEAFVQEHGDIMV